MVKGRIHSVETSGMVDGPGIRYVIFMQGCLLRCKYCHNPDTWDMSKGREITVQELIEEIKDYIPFMKASGGGVTVSGGEPLIQIQFLIELFKELKKMGIHTTVDSSAGCFSTSPSYLALVDELIEYTDLFLLDLKQIVEEKHKELTGRSNKKIIEFAQLLSQRKQPVWIRHVLVPGHTDSEEDLNKLSDFIHTLDNVEKIEILPYHMMGIYKWENLGLQYPLEGVKPPTEESVEKATRILFKQ